MSCGFLRLIHFTQKISHHNKTHWISLLDFSSLCKQNSKAAHYEPVSPLQRRTKGDHYNQSHCFSKVTSEQCQWTICLFHPTIPLIYIAPLLIWQHLLNLCHNLSAEPRITIHYKEFRKWNKGTESSLERYYNVRYPFVISSALWELVLTSASVSHLLLFPKRTFGKLFFNAALIF